MPVFVNGVEISDDAVHREMQYHPAPTVERAMEAAARALVVKELLLQQARPRFANGPGNESDDELIDAVLQDAVQRQDTTQSESDRLRLWQESVCRYIQELVHQADIIGIDFPERTF